MSHPLSSLDFYLFLQLSTTCWTFHLFPFLHWSLFLFISSFILPPNPSFILAPSVIFSNSSPWIRQSNKYHHFLSNWKIHQLDPLKHHTILMLNIWEMRSKEQHLKAPHLHPHLCPHLHHHLHLHLLHQIQETKRFYDQGMGNRGEVFMTWEGFEPGTWSLELWDLKRFELRTL